MNQRLGTTGLAHRSVREKNVNFLHLVNLYEQITRIHSDHTEGESGLIICTVPQHQPMKNLALPLEYHMAETNLSL